LLVSTFCIAKKALSTILRHDITWHKCLRIHRPTVGSQIIEKIMFIIDID